jgi:hypothetical protein
LRRKKKDIMYETSDGSCGCTFARQEEGREGKGNGAVFHACCVAEEDLMALEVPCRRA